MREGETDRQTDRDTERQTETETNTQTQEGEREEGDTKGGGGKKDREGRVGPIDRLAERRGERDGKERNEMKTRELGKTKKKKKKGGGGEEGRGRGG